MIRCNNLGGLGTRWLRVAMSSAMPSGLVLVSCLDRESGESWHLAVLETDLHGRCAQHLARGLSRVASSTPGAMVPYSMHDMQEMQEMQEIHDMRDMQEIQEIQETQDMQETHVNSK